MPVVFGVEPCGRDALRAVDTARHNDAKRASEVCAGVQAGEIVVFDKAYVDFNHLYDLFVRGVFWVSP